MKSGNVCRSSHIFLRGSEFSAKLLLNEFRLCVCVSMPLLWRGQRMHRVYESQDSESVESLRIILDLSRMVPGIRLPGRATRQFIFAMASASIQAGKYLAYGFFSSE